MVITYNGLECFKIQLGDTVLAFNPISKESSHKSTKFGADICFVTTAHQDMNGVDMVTFGEKKPFVVSGPGEYEIKGIFVKGFSSHSKYDKKDLHNTIYLVTLEGMHICFLGACADKELSKEILEAIEEVDILFAPIGGDGVLSPADAYKLAVSLEPNIIVPMHYTTDTLKTFLKESGESVSAVPKLTLKKKDLEGKESEVVVLSYES